MTAAAAVLLVAVGLLSLVGIDAELQGEAQRDGE